MKKFYTGFLILIAFMMVAGPAQAQVCTPDTTISTPGFAPNPLPDGCVGQPYSEVVSFLFPNDTTMNVPPFGNITIPFDSFVVLAVNNIPTGLTYACDVGGSCTYVTSPPTPTRGCVLVSGTPTTPNTTSDSIDVVGQAWITILGSPTSINDTVRIALLVNAAPCGAGIFDGIDNDVLLTVAPNPVTGHSAVRFTLEESGMVSLTVRDMTGRLVADYGQQRRFAGENQLSLDGAEALPAGVYSLHLNVDSGKYTSAGKFIVVH